MATLDLRVAQTQRNIQMDRFMDTERHKQTNGQTNTQKNKQRDKQTNGRTDRLTDGRLGISKVGQVAYQSYGTRFNASQMNGAGTM